MSFKHSVRTGGIIVIYFHFFYNKKVLVCSHSIVVVVVGLDLAAFETVFQSLSGRLPERGRKRREMIVEIKNVQTTSPTAPTASATGPCPTIIHIVGCPGTGSLPRTIAPPNHPYSYSNCLAEAILMSTHNIPFSILKHVTHKAVRPGARAHVLNTEYNVLIYKMYSQTTHFT